LVIQSVPVDLFEWQLGRISQNFRLDGSRIVDTDVLSQSEQHDLLWSELLSRLDKNFSDQSVVFDVLEERVFSQLEAWTAFIWEQDLLSRKAG
jgi:hypothetical protein